MKAQTLWATLFLFGAVLCHAQAPRVTGEWRGIWTNPSGDVFTAKLTLEESALCKTCAVKGPVEVEGKIVWMLRKVGPKSPADEADKIGTTATEKVKGESKGDGLLVLNGYEADDPNVMKGIDQYRLAISDDGKVIGGITLASGTWTGQFLAVKVL